jgi:hypothetical protein
MTYAITLVKCATGEREHVLKILLELKKGEFYKGKVSIDKCYISFGWPDFILVFRGENVELIKATIVDIRAIILKGERSHLETSTIICTTQEDINTAMDENIKDLKI